MAVNPTVLAMLGKVLPQAWDAIVPHGPIDRFRVRFGARLGDEVALNPQPLPPGPAEVYVGAHLLNAIVTNGIIVIGGQPESVLSEIDDWCGTGWPRRWPHPPKDVSWDDHLVFAGAAAAAANLATQYEHFPEMQEVLARAAEALADRAVQ